MNQVELTVTTNSNATVTHKDLYYAIRNIFFIGNRHVDLKTSMLMAEERVSWNDYDFEVQRPATDEEIEQQTMLNMLHKHLDI